MNDKDAVGTDGVDFADPKVEVSQFERYKGRKGQTDRLGFLSVRLLRTYSYFYEGGGKRSLFRAPQGDEMKELCRKQLGEPDQRFGSVVFQYRTGENGELADEAKCQGKVKLWVVSEARYDELSNIHRSWPLLDKGFPEGQHDLQIQCTEEQYQRMNFTPCPLAHWKTNQKWYDKLKEREAKAQQKLQLAMGRTLSDLEIMELLGASVPNQTGSTDNTADLDLDDVLDAV